MSSEYYTIQPVGGLCNRIRVLLSYLVYARLKNKKLYVFWEIDQSCNGSFTDFFVVPKDCIFGNTQKEIDYKGCYTKDSYDRKLFIESFKELRLNDKVQKEVDKMIDRNLKPNYNAVHIRRNDFVRYAIKKGKFVDDSFFENFILKNNDKKVFIATDDRETQRHFINLPNTIYYKPIKEKEPDEKRQTPLLNAVIDIFVCIKANKFQGTKGSSFTELINILRQFK